MSFEVICVNCGAPSSPDIGICPYCKSVMTSEAETKTPAIASIKKFFNEGKLDQALSLAKMLEMRKPDSLKSKEVTLLYVQILIEAQGPSTKIKSLLNQALIDNPSDDKLLEYLEIAEAESNLSRQKDDAGEIALSNVIRRSPENVHALFLLGSHLLWIEKDAQRALRYLEQCVKLRPNFFRAKACLAAAYKKLGMKDLAVRFCKECASKAADPAMKQFFTEFAHASI